jgi:3',5'-nucleoside bisphosphate phosphatase
MIDLHMHSQESDGSLSPEALAEACQKAGLSLAALTDHDTLGGSRAFIDACTRQGIRGVAAVELSAEYGPGTMHILGYVPDDAIDPFQAALKDVQSSRAERNEEILQVLDGLGVHLTPEDVARQAGEGMTGRPHIAAAMLAKGYVSSRQEAFARYLGKGCPAYRDRFRFSPKACIDMIGSHGGVAVLAHPFTLSLSERACMVLVEELVSYGLAGIEIFYPEHNDDRRRVYHRIAHAFDLVITGGSDFHGALNPSIMLGRGFGNVFVDDSVWDALAARMTGGVHAGSI